MRLLIASRRYPPDHISGSETVISQLHDQAARHHQVRLVAGWSCSPVGFPPGTRAVRRHTTGHVGLAAAVWSEARAFSADAILANSVEIPRGRVPVVLIVHDLNFGRSGRSRLASARERLYRWQGRRVDRVVAVSEATRAALVAVGVPADRVRVITNGVDTDRFSPATQRPQLTPAAPGRHIVCYPGRILPGKGQHVAIAAVERLPRHLRDRVHLRITGAVADRAYLERLRAQAASLPVSFHADVPDIVPYLHEADVVLFPTLMTEGFGYTAVEAMAAGVPVVWSDQPAIREATGGIGRPVPQGDAAAMSRALAELLSDGEARAQLAAAGRELTVTRYRWSAVWERYEAVLREVARGAP